MSFAPTNEQKQAMTIVDRDLTVCAGAGSGKTKVLVERYIYLLELGFSFEDILAITFTRKAAQEMKARIRQVLQDSPRYSHLTEKLAHAQISTVHSFCQGIIAAHPLEAQVDPHFRMAEEWESKGVLSQVVADIVGVALQKQLPEISKMREEFRQVKELSSYIISVYEKMRSKGEQNFQIRDQREILGTQLVLVQQGLMEELENWIESQLATSQTASRKRVVEGVANAWGDHKMEFIAYDYEEKLAFIEELNECLKGQRGEFKQTFAAIQELGAQLSQIIIDLMANQSLLELSDLLLNVHMEYQKRKVAMGLLDFNDLEEKALELLAIPSVQKHYRYAHIMLDESQDTNSTQKEIVDLLWQKQTKLFVVGDPKQSIYRFRGAEVEVFFQAQQQIMEREGHYIFLKDNFRSRPGIIHFANQLFATLMQDDPVPYAMSRPNRPQIAEADVDVIVTPKVGSATDNRELQGQHIAQYIKDFVEHEGRSFSDITLLFRSMTNVNRYEQALQAHGIPFINLSGRGFYQKQEILDILNYIYWLQDSDDVVSMIAVLRSPFFLVSDAGLFWYRQGQLTAMDSADREKITDAHKLYGELQRAMVLETAPRFLSQLMDSTSFLQRLREQGEQPFANVQKFLQTSWQLWAKGYVSLAEQLHYIDQITQQQGKEGEARLQAEDANVVTLMTIHGSKGLEFPYVILPDLNRELNFGVSGYFSYHPDHGLALRGTSTNQRIKEQIQHEELAEAKRLLYVAVTRAQERLTLCGIGAKEELELGPALDALKNWWEWLHWAMDCIDPALIRVLCRDKELENVELTLAATCDEARADVLEATKVIPALPIKYSEVTFSVTSLMVYAQCPLRYYYRYVLRVPEGMHFRGQSSSTPTSVLSPIQRGNIVHRVCEHLVPDSDVVELLQWAISMEGESLPLDEQQRLHEIILAYAGSEFFRKIRMSEVKREVEFSVPLDDYFITGTIDQLFSSPNGLAIMDLKTNFITADTVPSEARHYDWQMRIYAWAMYTLREQPIEKAQLYFLIPNVIYTHPDAHSTIKETEAWLRKTCQQIRHWESNGMHESPLPRTACNHCGYNCQQLAQSQQILADLVAGLGKLD